MTWLTLRLKLIRLLIGKLSVVANVTTDGNILLGDGTVLNSIFSDKLVSLPSNLGIIFGDRLLLSDGSAGIVVNNVFMGSRPIG